MREKLEFGAIAIVLTIAMVVIFFDITFWRP